MERIKIYLQYGLGVLLLIFSMFMFAENKLGSIVMFFASLVCIPVTRIFLETKTKIILHRQVKYLITVLGWLSIGVFAKPIDKNVKTDTSTPFEAALPMESKKEQKNENGNGASKNNSVVNYDANGNEKESAIAIDNLQKSEGTNKIENSVSQLKSKDAVTAQSNSNNKQNNVYNSNTQSSITRAKPRVYKSVNRSKQSTNRNYIRGPRGGCYYINGNGNKTYVDHSFCD